MVKDGYALKGKAYRTVYYAGYKARKYGRESINSNPYRRGEGGGHFDYWRAGWVKADCESNTKLLFTYDDERGWLCEV